MVTGTKPVEVRAVVERTTVTIGTGQVCESPRPRSHSGWPAVPDDHGPVRNPFAGMSHGPFRSGASARHTEHVGRPIRCAEPIRGSADIAWGSFARQSAAMSLRSAPQREVHRVHRPDGSHAF